jgi:hypothetical protein
VMAKEKAADLAVGAEIESVSAVELAKRKG